MEQNIGIDDIGISEEDIPDFIGGKTTDEERADTNSHERSNYNESLNDEDNERIRIEDNNNEPELETRLAEMMNEKAKAVVDKKEKEDTDDNNKDEDRDKIYKFLSEKFNIDEELIIATEEKYKTLSEGYSKINIKNVGKKDVELWAKEAKEHKIKTTNEKIVEAIVNSIMRDISDNNTLEVIKSHSIYIQKEQTEFFLSILDKINHWKEKINNAPEDIIKNKYVNHLFSEDYKFKVFKPNMMMYEENFVSDDGLRNFINVVKQLVTIEQNKELEKIKEFILSNNIDTIRLEKIFKL